MMFKPVNPMLHRHHGILHPTLGLLILLLGFWLRLHYLDRPAYLDESASFIDYAREPISTIVSTYFDPNNHVFYSILMHIAYTVLGFDVWVLRFPAFIAGLITLPLVYQMGARFYDHEIALLAMGISAASAPLIEYSVSGRGYTVITVCFLLLLWIGERSLRTIDNPPVVLYLCYAVVASIGFWTVPVMFYPMGIAALFWVVGLGVRRRWKHLLWATLTLTTGALLTLFLYTPILRAYGLEALIGNRHIVTLSLSDVIRTMMRLPRDMLVFFAIGLPFATRYLLLILLIVAGFGAFHPSSDAHWQSRLLIIAFAVWLTSVMIVQRVIPPLRVWSFAIPLVALWSASGIMMLWRMGHAHLKLPPSTLATHVLIAFLSLACAFSVVRQNVLHTYTLSSGANDAEAAAAFITEQLDDNDPVLFIAGWVHPLWYYLERDGRLRDRIWLTASPETLNTVGDQSLYLLAWADDPHFDNRLRDGFGVHPSQVADLEVVHHFPTEWVMYRFNLQYHVQP